MLDWLPEITDIHMAFAVVFVIGFACGGMFIGLIGG